jgi:hypothetical protein
MRKWTHLIVDALEQGILSHEAVVNMCLGAMSEDDVENMCRNNDLKEFLEPGCMDDPVEDEEEVK